MKQLTRIFCVLVCFVVGGQWVFAAPPAGERDGADQERKRPSFQQHMERVSDKLGLSDSQRVQVAEILREAKQKKDALRQSRDLEQNVMKSQMKNQMESIKAEVDAQLKRVISAEQLALFHQFMSERPRRPSKGSFSPASKERGKTPTHQ